MAAKVGLIDPDQRWWWTEEWQQGEREAEEDIAKGGLSGPFHARDLFVSILPQVAKNYPYPLFHTLKTLKILLGKRAKIY